MTFDYVIFGASGFTGAFIAKDISENQPEASFALAGRSQSKLDAVNADLKRKADAVIIADVKDKQSLVQMAKQGKVLINAVGPYRFFGLAVVEAAIEAGAHYCDISGEPWFLEKAEFQFNKQAQEKNVYCVSACGFDSIPSDLGTEFTREQFLKKFPNDKLNAVDAYLTLDAKNGYSAHATTLECAVHGFSSAGDLIKLRKAAKSQGAEVKPPAGDRSRPKANFHVQPKTNSSRASLPFPGSDRSIVKRSQQRIAANRGLNPIEFFVYFTIANSFMNRMKTMFVGLVFTLMNKTALGRSLIIKHPSLFTAGAFSHEGPTQEQRDGAAFKFDFYGTGVDKANQIHCRVNGSDPGYQDTAALIASAAQCLLNERENLPAGGGVMTTAHAFKDTSLVQKLMKRGIQFSVV